MDLILWLVMGSLWGCAGESEGDPLKDSSTPSGAATTVTGSTSVPGSTSTSLEDTGEGSPLPPNILMVVIDDLGVDFLPTYGAEGASIPKTPTLDTLASDGLRFTSAWSTPLCSPSRAELLTGRYARHFDLGTVIVHTAEFDLPDEAVTLPEYLGDSWSTAFLGKWHLSSGARALTGPNDQGFGHWSGTIGNLGAESSPNQRQGLGYWNWERVTDGTLEMSTVYATTATVDDAVQQVTTLTEPWFVEVAFHAGHAPYHYPPPELLRRDWAGGSGGNAHKFGAMIEALDTELGRLLEEIDPARTLVMVVGDNGTPQDVVTPPAKGTTVEAGINVPVIVRGPGIEPGGVVEAPVGLVDLPVTVLDLAGVVTAEPLDGVSLRPCFTDPECRPRDTAFSVMFTPNGPGPHTVSMAAVRDDRYKLIERLHPEHQPKLAHALHDMHGEGEAVDLLLDSPSKESTAAHARLLEVLDSYMEP